MDKREGKDRIAGYREFLKDSIRKKVDFSHTDQNQGAVTPSPQKDISPEKEIIKLSEMGDWPSVKSIDLVEAIAARKSRRKYLDVPLMLDELAFLLWATQGVKSLTHGHTYRTVPSAGCRHSFETYLCVINVKGLDQGIYRYLPLDKALVCEHKVDNISTRISKASLGQVFTGDASVTFIWTTIPYRMEWRYGMAAHKAIAIDIGHVCQNLYLTCEAIDSGCCAIGEYDQVMMDSLIDVDGKDEFVIYMASVGKVKK